MSHLVNAAILVSAWSAAASDIYISSRFLFFLSRRGHAPAFLGYLIRYPRDLRVRSSQSDSEDEDELEGDEPGEDLDASSSAGSADSLGRRGRGWEARDASPVPEGESVVPHVKPMYVLPIASVLVSASVGLLTFLSKEGGGAAFSWLLSVASVASLQSWTGMLFTYIRWHQGTVYQERKYKDDDSLEAIEARAQIAQLKKARQWGQPYVSLSAFWQDWAWLTDTFSSRGMRSRCV